jgi:acetyl-CoA C-acetyltransferase
MSDLREVVVVSAKRTPVGSFQGVLSTVPATKLGSIVMQAALGAGLPNSVECMTINKVCGSGMKSAMLAAQAIQVGDADVIIAGGMENMSLAPYLLPKARTGYRMGNGQLVDSMVNDGLWDVYNNIHMGSCAEMCAEDRKYSREVQDKLAIKSYKRAQAAQKNGSFDAEIIPVEVPQRKGDPVIINQDEEPGRTNCDKIPKLRPAFKKDGTVTAAHASKINDGAAAMLVMSKEEAEELNLKPLVKIIAQASAAQAPEWFTTAPSKAIAKALEKANLKADDIDLWEINEAFAPVLMAAIDDFKIDMNKVNINGGAIAIGHPIGASGARIFATLIHAMKKQNAKLGLATLCIGGGEASAVIVERI